MAASHINYPVLEQQVGSILGKGEEKKKKMEKMRKRKREEEEEEEEYD